MLVCQTLEKVDPNQRPALTEVETSGKRYAVQGADPGRRIVVGRGCLVRSGEAYVGQLLQLSY